MTPPTVRVVELSVSKDPLPVREIPLLAASVNEDVVFKVPPLKIILLDTAGSGVAPKLAFDEIVNFPAEIWVAPVYVLVPLKISSPEPDFVKSPEPVIIPP